MDIYHIWCDLKTGAGDLDFADRVGGWLGHLKSEGLIADWRMTRRKLGQEHYPTSRDRFDGDKPVLRAGAACRAMQRIGQASERTRGAGLRHLRPGAFATWRRCAPLPMPDIAMRGAPGHDTKSSRSNGSVWPDSAPGTDGLAEFHIMVEVRDLAQLDAAFGRTAARAEPEESLHHGVNSLVSGVRFALYRDFPDANRERGQEKF